MLSTNLQLKGDKFVLVTKNCSSMSSKLVKRMKFKTPSVPRKGAGKNNNKRDLAPNFARHETWPCWNWPIRETLPLVPSNKKRPRIHATSLSLENNQFLFSFLDLQVLMTLPLGLLQTFWIPRLGSLLKGEKISLKKKKKNKKNVPGTSL